MEKISVIVPCYNEEESLPLFYQEIKRIRAELSEFRFELILVDDGSKDQTAKLMRKLAASDDEVRYILFSRNFGKESAMYAGLKNAKGDYVVIMDADLQHPPARIRFCRYKTHRPKGRTACSFIFCQAVL